MTATELFEKIRASTSSATGAGVSRPSYGFNETKTLKILEHEALARDLIPAYDAAGNLWIHLAGAGNVVPCQLAEIDGGWEPYVLMGSHVDSVDNGGNYDGLAGVIAGLEVITRMRDERKPIPRVRVVALRGEESAWFGAPYKGAKAIFGEFDSVEIRQAIGDEARNYASTFRGKLGTPLLTNPSLIKAFLELHIEQGPVLELEQKDPISVVTSIRGNVRLSVRCLGRADHSGTTPMHMRRDAVLGAASAVRAIHYVCKIADGHREQRDLYGTCGVFNTQPSASASKVADQVDFVVEFRSCAEEDLAWAIQIYEKNLDACAKEHKVDFEIVKQVYSKPVDLTRGVHEPVYRHIQDAVRDTTMRSWPMPSGAGHDAAIFAKHGVPAGMLFVRNQNGSHNPAEAMRIDDFILGVDALERAVRRIL